MEENNELINNPAVEYTDDNIRHLSDMEHVRTRPGMYIGKLGDGSHAEDGIYVLLKEVLDNSIDEFKMQAGWETGYGNLIQVDHGFGYVTWYAHLSKYKVRPGQKVVRGEVIGEVGNTGKSTGPHLHYEVHVKGKVQNPVNYYFMDLSAEDYDKMIQIAANHGKVFD